MATLDRQQSDQLRHHLDGVEQLLSKVDAEGAEEILDELYLLITQLYEQFPQLDREEE